MGCRKGALALVGELELESEMGTASDRVRVLGSERDKVLDAVWVSVSERDMGLASVSELVLGRELVWGSKRSEAR